MNENRPENWKLFFSTGLPQAYTYLKEKERQTPRKEESSGAQKRRG